MTKSTGLGQQLYIHGYDLSGDVGSIDNLSTPRSVHDVTGIDKSAVERILGSIGVELGYGAFFNDAGDLWTELSALPTTDRDLMWLFGTTIGKVGFGARVKQIDLPWSRAADGGLTATPSAQGSGGVLPIWGEVLTPGKVTVASAGAQSSLDGGASSDYGLVAYAQMFSLGSGTPTVLIEDSANDSTWATLITLSDLSGANTVQRATVTGTVDRYLRVNVTGTFTDAVIAVLIRRGTAQDIEDLS